MLDRQTSERLRFMLSKVQFDIMNDDDVPAEAAMRLIEKISSDGFKLIDELEGVTR